MSTCRCKFIIFLALICPLHGFAIEDEVYMREHFEESFLSGESKPITQVELGNIGAYIDINYPGEIESLVEFSFSNKLMSLLSEKEFIITFSIFDETEKLIAAFPPSQEGYVLLVEGYMLRLTVSSKRNFMTLDKGTIYFFDYKNF